jgi:hypothetical protein
VKKAKSMRACTNPECARRFCEHCLSVHMSEALEAVDADDDWLCPICRKVCCCAVQSCSKTHRHCKAYRYRLRRAELAAKRGSVSASSSAAQTPREQLSGVPPPPPLSSLRAALEAGFAAAAAGGAERELDTAGEHGAGTFKAGTLPATGSLLIKAAAVAAAAAAAASAANLSAAGGHEDKADRGAAPRKISCASGTSSLYMPSTSSAHASQSGDSSSGTLHRLRVLRPLKRARTHFLSVSLSPLAFTS